MARQLLTAATWWLKGYYPPRCEHLTVLWNRYNIHNTYTFMYIQYTEYYSVVGKMALVIDWYQKFGARYLWHSKYFFGLYKLYMQGASRPYLPPWFILYLHTTFFVASCKEGWDNWSNAVRNVLHNHTLGFTTGTACITWLLQGNPFSANTYPGPVFLCMHEPLFQKIWLSR